MGPPRKIGKIWAILGFSRPTQKMGREGPKWGGDAFLRHNKTSPTIWAERILILRTFDFWIFGVPNLPPFFFMGDTYFQESASIFSWVKKIRNLPSFFFMGEKYFQEFAPIFFMGGPHVGPPPTWAHPLGPRFGPRRRRRTNSQIPT